MSNDPKPNLRDLYKNKGKTIANEDKQSKEIVKERLSSGVELIFSGSAIPPVLKEKILKLKISEPKTHQKTLEPKTLTYKADKTEIQMLVLSFGLIYQRVLGSAIPSIQDLHSQFLNTYPQVLSFSQKECEQTLSYLHSEGLLYQYTPEILFEPLERSKDINQVFSLLQPSDTSLTVSKIKARFPNWSPQKIQNLINLLVENGLIIIDGDTLWFPQLS